jgi:carboxymethylenebutenolidase
MPLPSAPSVPLAPNVSLQPPLSRRGHGPGIIIIDPDYKLPDLPSALLPSENIDPPPQYKWAEEGYAVVRVSIRMDVGPDDWDAQSTLGKATEALSNLEECDVKDKFVLVGMPSDRACTRAISSLLDEVLTTSL